MSYEQILIDSQDRITTITLNRPDAMNAITPTMLGELNKAISAAADDESTGVLVLTGAGRAFSAGVDLKSLGKVTPKDGGVGGVLDELAQGFIDALRAIPKVVIAKVNGFCFTGALEIALACDLIYVAEKAKLGDTHVKFGLRPTWGMSQRLPRAVGLMRARELSYTAKTFTGRDAAEWGLANAAVPADKLDDAVTQVAGQILENSLQAVGACKDLNIAGMDTTLTEGLAIERGRSYTITDTADRLAEFIKK